MGCGTKSTPQDIKTSLKQSAGFPWKMVLSLSIFFNLAYGPYNTGEWHDRKKQMAREFFTSNDPLQEPFTSYIPLIAWEQGIEEPVFEDSIQALWDRIVDSPHWSCKGPLVKLMRWLSFFQCAQYYKGDLLSARMVLQKQVDIDNMVSDDEGPADLPLQQTKGAKEQSMKQELNAMKAKQGTWNLAPRLLTPKHIQQKDIVCIVTQATCDHHSEDARELLTPQQVQTHTVGCVTNNGWAVELVPGPAASVEHYVSFPQHTHNVFQFALALKHKDAQPVLGPLFS